MTCSELVAELISNDDALEMLEERLAEWKQAGGTIRGWCRWVFVRDLRTLRKWQSGETPVPAAVRYWLLHSEQPWP